MFALMAAYCSSGLGPFAQGLNVREEGAISILHETEQTESDHASRVLDARSFAENLLDFARRRIGSLSDAASGNCNARYTGSPWSSSGQKNRSAIASKQSGADREHREQGEAEHRFRMAMRDQLRSRVLRCRRRD